MKKTIQMTNRKLQAFYRGLQAVGDLTGAIPLDFSMAVAGTMRLNIGYLEDMEKVLKVNKDFNSYLIEVNKFRKKYAIKDKNGIAVIGERNNYAVDPALKGKFEAEVETLSQSKDFKKIVEDRQALVDEYEKNLDKITEAKVYTIDKSKLPDSINPRQLESIYDIVDEVKPIKEPKK